MNEHEHINSNVSLQIFDTIYSNSPVEFQFALYAN